MKQRTFLPILLTIIVLASFAPAKIGLFEAGKDIGNPKLTGSSAYDPSTKTYTMKGGGYNIWFDRDEFQYLFREMDGDFTVSADFEFVGKGQDGHRKVGWMVRESTDDNASHLSAVIHGDGLTVLQWRVKKGDKMRDPEDEIFSKEKTIQTIEVSREGSTYMMRGAAKGKPLQLIGTHEMSNFGSKVLVGLFICSHNPDVLEEARVSNVVVQKGKK
ncbi:hypothetical protein SAMN05216327_112105 [Dyadobacter sp. SG02]|uniref:hypothetical protein n=1 Tax=Dyadobacter sp. SG02 TaxID=1855291 RepID=UPI0008BEB8BF|nr:hypothetical protein [Dyadobacter sp. SG02]SEJ53864.1 hypothetical protein SAMN05216327_112105 [Dyadobacter sp. SG02]